MTDDATYYAEQIHAAFPAGVDMAVTQFLQRSDISLGPASMSAEDAAEFLTGRCFTHRRLIERMAVRRVFENTELMQLSSPYKYYVSGQAQSFLGIARTVALRVRSMDAFEHQLRRFTDVWERDGINAALMGAASLGPSVANPLVRQASGGCVTLLVLFAVAAYLVFFG